MDTSELKIGDYFITRRGDVGQVLSFGAATNTFNSDIGLVFRAEVSEFSKDLRDLVKAGDYVNGARISQSKDGYLSYNGASIKSANIQQFMTKKKFYRECYTPGQNNEKVQWKTCVGFPKYEVSDSGVVRAKASGKFMSLLRDRIYWSVRLEDTSGHRLRKSVAVLVLEAFDSASNGRMPKFKNGDPEDCRLENLEWETRSEQASRVLPKVNKSYNKNYTYVNIVGYMINKPIIYASNTRELINILQTNNVEFTQASSNHIARNIKESKPYKGILLKCLPKEEYDKVIKTIDLNSFGLNYESIIKKMEPINNFKKGTKSLSEGSVVKDKKMSQISQKVVRQKEESFTDTLTKVLSDTKEKARSINDIDDSAFYEEQKRLEEERRNKFKEELLRRMKQ